MLERFFNFLTIDTALLYIVADELQLNLKYIDVPSPVIGFYIKTFSNVDEQSLQ